MATRVLGLVRSDGYLLGDRRFFGEIGGSGRWWWRRGGRGGCGLGGTRRYGHGAGGGIKRRQILLLLKSQGYGQLFHADVVGGRCMEQ